MKPERVVVITGASAGVGRATARAFAREGAALGLIARGRDGLDAARAEIEALGGRSVAIEVDVADGERVEHAAERFESELGPIDVWVNDAMASVFAPVEQTTAEEYRRVTEVTYLGCVHGTLAALRFMRKRDRGVIIQVGSALAYRSIPLQSAYCAAKHACRGFTDSLRCELLHERSGVRVTSVHLPALDTPQFGWVRSRLPGKPRPVPPIFRPEVAADAIVWASHHRRREWHVGGPTVLAIAAARFAPRLADLYLASRGYDAQQDGTPDDPGRPDNLFEPLSGDHGAAGRFDGEARASSAQAWVSRHRRVLLAFAALGVVAACAGRLRLAPHA